MTRPTQEAKLAGSKPLTLDAVASLQEDYALLLGERDAMWTATSTSSVDAYIARMNWESASERERELVTGNIRAFASYLRGPQIRGTGK